MSRRTLATLRGLVRAVLLAEAATSAAELLDRDPTVELVLRKGSMYPLSAALERVDPETGETLGLAVLHAGPPKPSVKTYGGPCRPRDASGATMDPAWEVKWSRAESGLGPLIYDAAMEALSLIGASLTSDRDEVSDSAQRVWGFYARQRRDVVPGILDDENGTLTPDDPKDDCSQFMSKSIAADAGTPDAWHEEPTSRAYTVPKGQTPTIDAFRRAGRLRTVGFSPGIFDRG